jgi:hypothetical protein
MAFSFVVETGTADSDATSYATVEFADDYVEANTSRLRTGLRWTRRTSSASSSASSKVLDIRFKWNGQRVDQDSGLKWPRVRRLR